MNPLNRPTMLWFVWKVRDARLWCRVRWHPKRRTAIALILPVSQAPQDRHSARYQRVPRCLSRGKNNTIAYLLLSVLDEFSKVGIFYVDHRVLYRALRNVLSTFSLKESLRWWTW